MIALPQLDPGLRRERDRQRQNAVSFPLMIPEFRMELQSIPQSPGGGVDLRGGTKQIGAVIFSQYNVRSRATERTHMSSARKRRPWPEADFSFHDHGRQFSLPRQTKRPVCVERWIALPIAEARPSSRIWSRTRSTSNFKPR